MGNIENNGGTGDNVRKPIDGAGMAFKAMLLLMLFSIAYFLIKPVWDQLFRSLPPTPVSKNDKKSDKTPDDEPR